MSSKIEKGDMVEVVESTNGTLLIPPITKGHRHVANEVRQCPNCKDVYLDIGLSLLNYPHRDNNCFCGHLFSHESKPYYDVAFFRKVEPDYKLVEIEASVREELKKFNVTEKIDA